MVEVDSIVDATTYNKILISDVTDTANFLALYKIYILTALI